MTVDSDLLMEAGISLPATEGTGTALANMEWPEPEPPPSGLPPVPEFDECLLPESLRPWLADIAERAQAPLDFPAVGAIVGLSSMIGRRLGIRPKREDDWLVVPNLWGLIVGPPGVLKTPMLNEVLKAIMRLEERARADYKTALAEYELRQEVIRAERRKLLNKAANPKSKSNIEKLMADLRAFDAAPPRELRYIVNDPTVEKLGEILNRNPQGVLLFRDEIAGLLASMERAGHENDRAFYLEAWNGTGGYIYDRIGRGTLDIEAACVSILGAITPGPLGAYLRETFSGQRDDGLIQRFQVCAYPDPSATWSNVDRSPNADAKNDAYKIFDKLSNVNPASLSLPCQTSADGEISYLRFDSKAQEFFDGWREELETDLRNSDEHPVMLAHLAKYRSLMPSHRRGHGKGDRISDCPAQGCRFVRATSVGSAVIRKPAREEQFELVTTERIVLIWRASDLSRAAGRESQGSAGRAMVRAIVRSGWGKKTPRHARTLPALWRTPENVRYPLIPELLTIG
jgi:Protein of unknown function (DUF3987)